MITIREGEAGDLPYADETFDCLVTDPPYHLSNTKPLEDRVNEVLRVFNDVVFPDFNEGDVEVTKYSELARVLGRSSDLSLGKVVGGVESWVGVPEGAVDFKADMVVRQVEITAGAETAGGRVADTPLVDEGNPKISQFIGDFVFDFRDSLDFPCSDIPGSNFGKALDCLFAVPISSLFNPSGPPLQTPDSSFLFGNHPMGDVGSGNDSLGQTQGSISPDTDRVQSKRWLCACF